MVVRFFISKEVILAKRSKTAQQAFDVALPIAVSQGLDLVDCEYKKEGQKIFLRLFIDKKGGVTLDDCERFHNEVEPLIDAWVESDEDYFEVSSPGLTRPLTDISDYVRYEGEMLDVTLYKETDGVRNFTSGYKTEEDRIIFENGIEVQLKDIAKAVRHIDF